MPHEKVMGNRFLPQLKGSRHITKYLLFKGYFAGAGK
jgi:hypothetical protein